MNGLEKIQDRIRNDAQREINTLREDSERHAGEIIAEFQHQADKLLRESQEKSDKAAQDREVRLQGSAAMEGRQCLLAEKQQCIDEAFRKAREELNALDETAYIRLLAQLASRTGQGSEEIVLSKADRDKVGQAVVTAANAMKPGAAFTLSAETRELGGGLVLKDGRVEHNCTFDTILSALRQDMASEIANILFT